MRTQPRSTAAAPGAPSSRAATSLVTGGAGFVGSHLVAQLSARGHRVVVLDDLSTGRRANLAAVPGIELVVGSVLDRGLVSALVDRCDHVFHLAAVVGLAEIGRRPGATRRVSVAGTKHVVEAAAARGDPLRSFLFTSSSEVYGAGPFAESRVLSVPVEDGRGRYAHAKWMAERLVQRARPSGRTVVARLFNTVGPRQRAEQGLVLARWRAQIAAGRPLTVYGDGRQTRCFAHVDAVVDQLVRLALDPLCHSPSDGRADPEALVVNVGHDRPVRIGDLARRLVARVGGDVVRDVVQVPFESAFAGARFRDPRDRRPDLGMLRALLGRGTEALDPTRGDPGLERLLDEIARGAAPSRVRPVLPA